MSQFVKTLGCAAGLALGAQSALGFAIIGPPPGQTPGADQWQVSDLGFFVPGRGDIGGPKSLGEEYRRNTPVLYYTFDANFLDYFGNAAAAAVDKAFSVYNSLTNVSSYSTDLSEFPLQTVRENSQALSLGMIDVKSAIMTLLAENLGLADSVRYTWNLHDRNLPPGGTCPFDEEYLVVMRNYDPVIGSSLSQYKPSAYVNGVLYDYYIHDYCTLPAGLFDALSEAREFSVDPDADSRLPVATTFGLFASAINSGSLGFQIGAFFTGLTRDDVGGLRYLLSANNMNVESTGPNTTAFETNYTPQLLFTSNLTLLAQQALTNPPAALQALYPGLTILASSNYFGVLAITNFTPYFTNFPWQPATSPPRLAFVTNITYTPVTFFVHTFGNLFLVSNTASGFVSLPLTTIPPHNGHTIYTIQTISVTNVASPWTPATTFTTVTNVTLRNFVTNTVVGDFYILPTNSCGVAFVEPLLTNITLVTNVLFATTNFSGTNSITATNVAQSVEQDLIQYLTNRVFVILPIACVTNNTALYQGVERITFIRRDYDSLLTRLFYPITNEYVLNAVSNNTIIPQRVQRVVATPDFLITAQDLSPGPAAVLAENVIGRTNTYNTANIGPGLAGPGTLQSPSGFVFNKASPIYGNFAGLSAVVVTTNAFLENNSQLPWVVWASYDGTTNPPVVYPDDLSINQLEDLVLIQVTPQYLPDAYVGVFYSVQLQTQSVKTNTWQAPFTFTLAPNSPGLPPNLSITTSNIVTTVTGTTNSITNSVGIISGTPPPGSDAFYDFMVQIMDSQGRTTQRSFSIRVNP